MFFSNHGLACFPKYKPVSHLNQHDADQDKAGTKKWKRSHVNNPDIPLLMNMALVYPSRAFKVKTTKFHSSF